MRRGAHTASALFALAVGCASLPDRPPREAGRFRVELVRIEPKVRLDVRYATERNFVGRPVYRQARVFLQRPAAEAVARAHRGLAARDYAGATPAPAERRRTLREAMVKEGFLVFPSEWWHFDYEDWREYPILDEPFEELGAPAAVSRW